jgi:hypothetical protein
VAQIDSVFSQSQSILMVEMDKQAAVKTHLRDHSSHIHLYHPGKYAGAKYTVSLGHDVLVQSTTMLDKRSGCKDCVIRGAVESKLLS